MLKMHRLLRVAVCFCTTYAIADDALREAAEALAKEDYKSAIPHLQSALQDDPKNFNARFNLAFAFQAEGNNEEAIRHYNQIAVQQPDLIPARQNLAILLLDAGLYADAIDDLESVTAAIPDDKSTFLALGFAHGKTGNPGASIAAYRQVLGLDPASLDAMLGLGAALVSAGRLSESVPVYLKAVEVDPSSDSILLELAETLESAGMHEDAMVLFRQYAATHSGDAYLQERIGMLLMNNNDAAAAIQPLSMAVEIEPNASRHALLAEAYRQTGEQVAFLKQLKAATLADPQDPVLLTRYATALLKGQNYENAMQQYMAAVRIDPQSQDAWNGLAFVMFQSENYPAVLHALEQSVKAGPPRPASIYLKALAQDKLQLYKEAQATYQGFLAMNPEMPDEEWKARERLKVIGKVLSRR